MKKAKGTKITKTKVKSETKPSEKTNPQLDKLLPERRDEEGGGAVWIGQRQDR
jgi:hypothetical protein